MAKKKNQPKTEYNFNDILQQKKQNPKSKEDPRKDAFIWNFNLDYMNWNHKDFGWKKVNITKDFLTNITQNLYIKYNNKTWDEVDNTNHCGAFKKGLNKQQKEVLKGKLDAEKQKKLYHICLDQRHRLYGYRDNGIFYVVLNDPDHKFNKI